MVVKDCCRNPLLEEKGHFFYSLVVRPPLGGRYEVLEMFLLGGDMFSMLVSKVDDITDWFSTSVKKSSGQWFKFLFFCCRMCGWRNVCSMWLEQCSLNVSFEMLFLIFEK